MTDLEKKQLLEEAKRRFPIGTKFKVVHLPHEIRTVKSHDYYINTFVKKAINLLICEKDSCEGASVYNEGKWAEIVSYPEGYIPETNHNLILAL